MRQRYCEPCDKAVKPASDGDCPYCGAGLVTYPLDDEREKDEDDGREYGHPADAKAGRD